MSAQESRAAGLARSRDPRATLGRAHPWMTSRMKLSPNDDTRQVLGVQLVQQWHRLGGRTNMGCTMEHGYADRLGMSRRCGVRVAARAIATKGSADKGATLSPTNTLRYHLRNHAPYSPAAMRAGVNLQVRAYRWPFFSLMTPRLARVRAVGGAGARSRDSRSV